MLQKTKKGSSLLMTLLIIAALLSIALGLSKLAVGEAKLSRDVTKSLIAYYAADSGGECQMYADRFLAGVDCGVVCISADVCFDASGTDASLPYYRIITSKGTYQDTQRAVELKY